MNRSTILLLGLAAWVLAACGSSTSMEEAHEDEHDHMEEHDDHGHGHEEPEYEQMADWLQTRMEFDPPQPTPGDMMLEMSIGAPGPATWEGAITGHINPYYEEEDHGGYTHPWIELVLEAGSTNMHANIFVDSNSEDDKLVHHLDANVTGPTFTGSDGHENEMTGTFYGPDHGTVVGTVNTAIVIGTYEATEHDHDHDH